MRTDTMDENVYGNLSVLAEAMSVFFKVIIGHNSRADRSRESVKTTSDSEDSNAFFEVRGAY